MFLGTRVRLGVCLPLIVLIPGIAFGWGETGHRIVCQMAYDEAQPEAREELDRLLALDPDFDNFADACLFADEPERIRWRDHFINLPRSLRAVTTFDCPMAETCLLPAIRDDFLVLLDPLKTDAEKLLALKLLGHWVGDVHQPMHVSFQDDRGANNLEVRIGMELEFPNLHSIWDYVIVAHSLGDDFHAAAATLRAAISNEQRLAWRYDSPVEWANESFQITIAPDTGYCLQQQGACWYAADNMLLDQGEEWRSLEITDEYLQLHGPTVTLRLQQAAVRLARLIDQSLGRGTDND